MFLLFLSCDLMYNVNKLLISKGGHISQSTGFGLFHCSRGLKQHHCSTLLSRKTHQNLQTYSLEAAGSVRSTLSRAGVGGLQQAATKYRE